MLGRREHLGWTFENKGPELERGLPVRALRASGGDAGGWRCSRKVDVVVCVLVGDDITALRLPGKSLLGFHALLARFSASFPLFVCFFCCCSRLVFVFPQLRSGSACLLGDYPPTAGTESICRAPNLLRCEILKNKCWLNLQRASDKRGEEEEKPLGVC